MDEFIYLWPIYGSALVDINPDPNPALTGAIKAGGNVCVLGQNREEAHRALVTSLRICAKESYDALTSRASALTPDAWLVVDVPIPTRVEPRDLLHRMIRRLYFSAVLHGMGEINTFRETVQVLRIAYLQTRGTVSQGQETESVDRGGVELGGKLSANPEFSAKLSAGDEVKVVEKLNAEMARLDLFEAEDELTYDLTILQRLEMFADRHAQAVSGTAGIIPRWEKVRGWFKDLYAPLQTHNGIRLRAAYVFESASVTTSLSLIRFFAQAAGLASSQSAQILLAGGPELEAAHAADSNIGEPVFRGAFEVQRLPTAAQGAVSTEQKNLLKEMLANPPESWTPEIGAIAKGMSASWAPKRTRSKASASSK